MKFTTAAAAPSGSAALGLRPELLEALAGLGYEEPTPIQREVVPLLLGGPRPARLGVHGHRPPPAPPRQPSWLPAAAH